MTVKGVSLLALVSSNLVCDVWPVDSADSVCHGVVCEILHLLGGGVIMIVASLSVVTEAVSMLHTKI